MWRRSHVIRCHSDSSIGHLCWWQRSYHTVERKQRARACTHTYTHTHTRLTALCPGPPRWAGTSKVKPIWILLKQETVSGSGISWAVCKSAPRSRQIFMPAPHHSVFFTGRMPFLPPNQQRHSTEGTKKAKCISVKQYSRQLVISHFPKHSINQRRGLLYKNKIK